MQYVSTRNKEHRVSAAQAIAAGIAPDGGLYCPEEIPALSAEQLGDLCRQPYWQRAAAILGLYLTDFSAEELREYTQKAYRPERFGGEDTAPVVSLRDGKEMLELWHGPTCAFKDMALQILPYLLTASLKKIGEDKTVCILVATSGDTGKAALDGFADVPGTKIMVYYPSDGVSKIQKLQMMTQRGDNVQVCAIEGNFDDAQTAVKQIFTDRATIDDLARHNLTLSSANSINWGRLAPQIAYYVSAYCDLVNQGRITMGEMINVCVPTGNFGNILAAYFAKRMGVPIDRLICASNVNHVLTDFFTSHGTYNRVRPFYTTTSPSMDILISSNLERLLFYATGENDGKVAEYMKKLNQDGMYTVDAADFAAIAPVFAGGYAQEEDVQQTIARTFREEGYLMDTHTAVAVTVYESYRKQSGDTKPTVIASTASPFKFCSAVLQALGQAPEGDGLELLDQLSQASGVAAPEPLRQLRGLPIRFDRVIRKEEILSSVQLLKDHA